MNWTNNKPTSPGWYFWRSDPDGFAEIARVEHAGQLWWSRWGAASPEPVAGSSGQWAGPIEEPK